MEVPVLVMRVISPRNREWVVGSRGRFWGFQGRLVREDRDLPALHPTLLSPLSPPHSPPFPF